MGGGRTDGDWQAEGYARHARFVADLAGPVVDLLAPAPGERILDVGCGDGALSLEVAARGGCEVVGVDASPDMVRAARARGLDARVTDATELAFEAEFDAAFSNAALHWVKSDPDAAIEGVARALRPGGRFAGEMGGQGNVAAIATALVALLGRRGLDGRAMLPWYFPTAAEYRARLEAGGFAVERIELLPRPTPLETGMAAWLETLARPVLRHLPPDERPGFVAEAVALLEPALLDRSGRWTADYVRLRFLARLPGGPARRVG